MEFRLCTYAWVSELTYDRQAKSARYLAEGNFAAAEPLMESLAAEHPSLALTGWLWAGDVGAKDIATKCAVFLRPENTRKFYPKKIGVPDAAWAKTNQAQLADDAAYLAPPRLSDEAPPAYSTLSPAK